MPITRREFLKNGAVLGAALTYTRGRARKALPVRPALDPNTLAPFVDPLPIPALARSRGFRPSPADPQVKLPYYRIEMRQFASKLHRDLKPTRQWGYESAVPGPTFETRSGK